MSESLDFCGQICYGVRAATVKAVELAKEGGALISFDPNLRPPLWENLEDAQEAIAWGLSQCDILKIADNELEFMTGEAGYEKGNDLSGARWGSAYSNFTQTFQGNAPSIGWQYHKCKKNPR